MMSRQVKSIWVIVNIDLLCLPLLLPLLAGLIAAFGVKKIIIIIIIIKKLCIVPGRFSVGSHRHELIGSCL